MVDENRMLRRIFRHIPEEVAGGERRLNCGELFNYYSSSNIIMITKSRKGDGPACIMHRRNHVI
jgi:hypothetical protein